MRNHAFGLALCATLFALCSPVWAQQAKVPKIGWLGPGTGAGPGTELFRRELGALGYVDGKNIAFEYRHAESKLDRLPALANELIRLKVDVLVTSSSAPALALKNATRTMPIVFYSVPDPVTAGLVDSLARPGGNITGFTIVSVPLGGKRLEVLKEIIPKLSRVAMLWNPKELGSTQEWKENQLSARELGLQVHSMEVSSADKYESAFKEATKARSAALTLTGSSLDNSNLKLIADLTVKNRLPAMGARGDFVDSSGLMSYGADQTEPYKRIAWMVDKILKGTKPADIPVEQPTKFELMINLKTAKALGLTIPPIILMRAQRVIK
jgi:putative tryptophan/tyrosine transport system substrate-binding protein